PVQRPVQPIAGAVAGEHPPRAVSPVGRRGETHDEDRGVDRPERGHRAAPVLLGGEGGPFLGRGLALAPLDEPRAQPALREPGVHGHSRSRAATVTCDVAFHSIQPMPWDSATSIWRLTWAAS